MIRPFGLLRRIGTTVSDIIEAIRGKKKIRYITVDHRRYKIGLESRTSSFTLPTNTITLKDLRRSLPVPRRKQAVKVKREP